jgi:hypothetical protein
MESRKDDRDAKKSLDEATGNPWDANQTGADQQAAELQTDDHGERQNLNRFAPDPASEKQPSQTPAGDAHQGSKDEVKEP